MWDCFLWLRYGWKMPRNCLSGVSVDCLLLFLLQLCDLTSAVDNSYVQNDTVVCDERQARFKWKYKVKSSLWTVLYHKREKIGSSANLPFSPEEISSDQFKGRLTVNTTDQFSFTLENATKVDNGMYEWVFSFVDGSTDSLVGNLEVKDFLNDDTLVMEVEREDRCVNLTCRADPPCMWIFPNRTSKVAKTIHYCSKKTKETIRCESEGEHVCTYANYPNCSKSIKNRQRRSSEDKFCPRDDSNSDATDPGTDPINPVPIVPIVLGVLAPIIAIAVITGIIVFYKRRSRQQGVQGPPVHYNSVPVEGNQDM